MHGKPFCMRIQIIGYDKVSRTSTMTHTDCSPGSIPKEASERKGEGEGKRGRQIERGEGGGFHAPSFNYDVTKERKKERERERKE